LATGHLSQIYSIGMAPDGRRFATASADGTVRQWHAATEEEVASTPPLPPLRQIIIK
jgi:WD40 repeat protein